MDLGTVSFTFYVCDNCCLVGTHIVNPNTWECKRCKEIVRNITRICYINHQGKIYDPDLCRFFSNAGQMVNYYDDSKPFKADCPKY
jgi:hypothetical protein